MTIIFALAGVICMAEEKIDRFHCDFARFESTVSVEGNPVKQTRCNDGWRIVIPKIGVTDCLRVPNSDWNRKKPAAIALYATALKGKAYCRLVLVTPRGIKTTGYQWITPESSRVEFALPDYAENSMRLQGIAIEPSAPDTEILLRRVAFVENGQEKEKLNCVVSDGGQKLPFFEKWDGKVTVRNGAATPCHDEAEFLFHNVEKQKFLFEKSISLPPYGEETVTLSNESLPDGVWYLDYRTKGETSFRRAGMLAVMSANGTRNSKNKEMEFASDNHWINQEIVDAMDFVGIQAVRSIVSWERLQPDSANQWQFDKIDAKLKFLDKAGIAMRETLVFTPRWAAMDNPQKLQFPRNREPRLDAWEKYVQVMVEKYGSRLEFLEVWNEPDLPYFANFPVDRYIVLLKRVYEIAKKANPDCKIASGGFATLDPGHPDKPGQFHESVLREAGKSFDIHSYHEHGYFPHYQNMVDNQFLPLRKKYGITQPWLASENSMYSSHGRDIEQADCLFKKLLFTWARGGYSYTWYGVADNGYDLNYSEDNYGMVDKFMRPKFVFGTYAALIRLYRQAKFLRQIQGPSGEWLFLFEDTDRKLIASWNADGKAHDDIIAVSGVGKTAKLADLNGQMTSLPVEDGVVLFHIGACGKTVILPDCGDNLDVTTAATLVPPKYALTGKTAKGEIVLNNPWNRKFSFAFQINSEFPVEGLPDKVELAPKERKAVPFEFRIDDASGNEKFIRIALVSGESKMPLSVGVRTAKICGDEPFDSKMADFTLNQAAQAFGNFEFNPNTTHLLWNGADDLSGEVRLARRNNILHVQVKVHDDKFTPTPVPTRMWEGDSVQLSLGLPGRTGRFEFGAGLDAAGKLRTGIWHVPSGISVDQAQEAFKATAQHKESETSYDLTINLEAFGISEQDRNLMMPFNCLLNDNDGRGRKSYLRLAPGIGESSPTMAYAPLVVLP